MIIELINEYINRGLRLLLTLFMAVMIIAVVWQVFTRFVLNDPANFTDELSRYLLIWIGVLGGRIPSQSDAIWRWSFFPQDTVKKEETFYPY